jgi:TPR repeat protein
LGENDVDQDIKQALELASVCEHPNTAWLTKLFGGRAVASREEARQVFLGCEKDPRALCFAALLGGLFHKVRQTAVLGDAFAQAWMADGTTGQDCFRWAEQSVAQGERDGFYQLGHCYGYGIGCVADAERAQANFTLAAELGDLEAMFCVGKLLDKNDPRRFFWFGTAAASGESFFFLSEMRDQIHTGHSKVVFAIG